MYLDTANIDEIKESFTLGVMKGVTTNPSILLKEGRKRESVINDILGNSEGIVFVQAVGDSCEEIYNDSKEILQLHETRVALKIPANSEGLKAIKKLKGENPQVVILATAIFSVEQGFLSALAGCDFIAPYVNRMENNNIDPYEVIRKTRKIFDDRNLPTQILAASFKNTNQVVDILAAGAHTATVPFDILNSMLNKVLATASIKKFNQDWVELQGKI
ncbi:transaldolase family protein [Bacillus sp. 1NLA3E]|uniref:transaldolase family protein n=1 Tax=Bacillus sp. 1NLA3E TaxID=666686 RepID=UPI000247E2D7|nr:transaldolase family protein [Bacillus sp. 1NLA3E]AGK55430.1 translaldolase [Bacillus sp. 1NLA3E]